MIKKLDDFDIYYQGSLVRDIIEINTFRVSGKVVSLQIEYINEYERYESINDSIDKFKFKYKK